MSPDCQPLARQEGAVYRPACLCGWSATFTRANRAEALAIAYARHDSKESAA